MIHTYIQTYIMGTKRLFLQTFFEDANLSISKQSFGLVVVVCHYLILTLCIYVYVHVHVCTHKRSDTHQYTTITLE